MAQFILNQFERGLEENIYKPLGISGNIIILGLADMKHFDPFAVKGVLKTIPKQVANVGGTFNDSQICDYIHASDGLIYGVGRISAADADWRLFNKATVTTNWATEATAAAGANHTSYSMIAENRGYLYFNSASYLVQYDLTANSAVDNWDTFITSCMMFPDGAGNLYFVDSLNANVYVWDGTTKPAAAGAKVSLGSDFDIIGGGELRNWMGLVAVNATRQTFLYLWDKATVNKFDTRIALRQTFIAKSAIMCDGLMYVFGYVPNDACYLYTWDGATVQELGRIPDSAASILGGDYRCISSDGKNIYIFYGTTAITGGTGRIIKASRNGWCYERYALDNTEIGIGATGLYACRYVNSSLFLTYQSTTDVITLSRTGTSYSNTAYFETTVIGTELVSRQKILKNITALFKSLPANTTLTMQYKIDQASSWSTFGATFSTTSGVYFMWSESLPFRTLQLRLEISGTATATFELLSLSGEYDYSSERLS